MEKMRAHRSSSFWQSPASDRLRTSSQGEFCPRSQRQPCSTAHHFCRQSRLQRHAWLTQGLHSSLVDRPPKHPRASVNFNSYSAEIRNSAPVELIFLLWSETNFARKPITRI